MLRCGIGVAVVVLATIAPAAHAQEQCSVALTATGRDTLHRTEKSDLELFFFKQVCQSGATSATLDSSGSYFEVARGMLGLTYSNSNAYCEATRNSQLTKTFSRVETSTVVEAALRSWLECVRLNHQGIRVTPQVLRGRATISFERISATLGTIRGVDATAGTVCSGQLVGGASGAQESTSLVQVLTKDTVHTIPAAEQFVVVCDRKGVPSKADPGSTIYPYSIVTIGTNVGAFNLELDADAAVGEAWASDLMRRLEQKLDRDAMPEGDYVVLAGSTGCPRGFREVRAGMGAIVTYLAPDYHSVIQEGTFGKSTFTCDKQPCSPPNRPNHTTAVADNLAFTGGFSLVACVR